MPQQPRSHLTPPRDQTSPTAESPPKKMPKNEFDGISEEDMEDFKALLVQFYGKPWEQGYALLKKEIEDRLRRKDTNSRYRSYLSTNMEDLVMTVTARYIKINAKLRRAGKEILNFYAMLENRIDHVHHEMIRELSRSAGAVSPDHVEVISQTTSIDRAMEETEARKIEAECQKRCLDELPEHILDIFLEYYDVEGLTPAARTSARRKLAVKVARIPPTEATPEAVTGAKRNLDIMLSKWRHGTLKLCKEKCLKERHLR